MANNELALQCYQLGFFDPSRVDQAIATLSIMDFDGKEEMQRIIERNGTMYSLLQDVLQFAMALAAKSGDRKAMQQMQGIMQKAGGGMTPQMSADRSVSSTR